MLRTLAVAGYRSLRNVVVPLRRLTVVTGPNGSGKSSLYRALRLLADTSHGALLPSLAREGGMPSVLWAGPEKPSHAMRAGRAPVQGTVRKDDVRLKLGFASDDFGYAIELGLPPQNPPSAFSLDPEIKRECIWSGEVLRRASLLVDRRGPGLRATDEAGAWQTLPRVLAPFDSMMTEFSDPRSAPEMILLRERIRSWRFYDQLRSDPDAPARAPQVGTHTPILADDGHDLAAAIQTILEIGDEDGFTAAIDDAFPGAALAIEAQGGRFRITLRQPGLLRPLDVAELSDGTLRFVLLAAALFTPRPPEVLVLNEPETSLHPDIVPALVRLIGEAASRSQVVVITHNRVLINGLSVLPDAGVLQLCKELGETRIDGIDELTRPSWAWPPG